jgi:Ca2+-binding EF-hand superfamily protein
MTPTRLLVPAVLAAALCACDRGPAPAADTAAAPAATAPSSASVSPAPMPDAAATATSPASAQFARMDTNGDGRISADEHAAGAAAMFRTMDSDADGKVTVAEMDAAQATLGGDPRMSSLEKIRTVDRNQDDVLTAQEHAIGAQDMFGQMDVDASGDLTPAEMEAGHAAMMGHAVPDAPPAKDE